MALFSVQNTRIAGMVAAVPKETVHNTSLDGFGTDEMALLIQTTGIETRRIAPLGMCASDLCYQAALSLMQGLNWKPEDVEALVFVTQTPDYQLPGNSMLLQERLGLSTECVTLDIHQGCAGYVYGLASLSGLMSASGLRKALLLVGDTITQLLDPNDKGTVPIFSDAGSATALVLDEKAEAMYFHLQSSGANAAAIRMEGSGARLAKGDAFMRMRGLDIFTFGLKEVAPNIESLLKYCSFDKEKVDYFVFHQANRLLNESIRKKLNIPSDKVPYTLQDFGNTSCATIPLTLVHGLGDKLGKTQQKIVLSGFGVGLSWGSALVSIGEFWSQEILEVHEV